MFNNLFYNVKFYKVKLDTFKEVCSSQIFIPSTPGSRTAPGHNLEQFSVTVQGNHLHELLQEYKIFSIRCKENTFMNFYRNIQFSPIGARKSPSWTFTGIYNFLKNVPELHELLQEYNIFSNRSKEITFMNFYRNRTFSQIGARKSPSWTFTGIEHFLK